MPIWAQVVASLAAVLVVFGLSVVSGLAAAGSAPLPLWVYGLLSASFGAVGATLLFANRQDVRASWLGGVLLLIGFQSIGPFLGAAFAPIDLAPLRPDAFLPAFAWYFVSEFPSRQEARIGKVTRGVGHLALVFGLLAFTANLTLFLLPAEAPRVGVQGIFAAARTPGSAYWAILFLLCLQAFLALVVRAVMAPGADRTRIRIFATGLAAGALPLFLEVVLEEASPSFKTFAHLPSVEPWVGAILFAPLATVPFTTAYSVFYDHIVTMRVVLRAAIQYALARWFILGVALVPLIGLLLYLHQHRAVPLIELLTGTRPVILITAGTAGAMSLRVRRRLLHAIDRRFFREQYDTELLVTNLMSDAFSSQTPADIAQGLAVEIDRAIHAKADLFVVDDSQALLADPRGERTGLPADAVLVGLAMADSQPMDIQVGDNQWIGRLPAAEQVWLRNGSYRLIIALRTRNREPIGLIALSEKRSGLPFAAADRRSLAALATPLAAVLENERLRRLPEPPTELPARECQVCSRLHEATSARCSCGGTLEVAQAPHVLRGQFKFEQRIGAGGMGVVYRATDLTLARTVAIKTLPRVTPEHVRGLKREAQAMASMVHANLAVVYGIEMWRGVPFLVEEYLAGGTLADRLRAGRLTPGAAIDLGITLASVLGQLHAAGIVHCDIKPSNIGFNDLGVVKLLDFGLARLLRDGGPLTTTASSAGGAARWADSAVLSEHGVAGTPPYMSPEATRALSPRPAVDLWALAVVLYEAMAGRRPFTGDSADDIFRAIQHGIFPSVQSLRPDCPAEVSAFFDRALAARIEVRPASAADLLAELSALRPGSSLN